MKNTKVTFIFDKDIEVKRKSLFEDATLQDTEVLDKYFSPHFKVPLQEIKYYVFSTRERKYTSDPFHSISRASARWHKNAIYRYWEIDEDPHFPHELVHLYAHNLGAPYDFACELDTYDAKKIKTKLKMVSTSFMQEGLAVALDDVLFKRKIHENGRWEYLDKFVKEMKGWSFLSESILNIEGFGKVENKVVVPFSGYFSKYLIREFGLKKYIIIYTALQEINTPQENAEVFETHLGPSFTRLLQACKNSI